VSRHIDRQVNVVFLHRRENRIDPIESIKRCTLMLTLDLYAGLVQLSIRQRVISFD
jgi:hypothetical protein